MSVREYRDAVREVHRIEDVIVIMKADLNAKIDELKQDIIEAESELEDDRKKATDLGKKLKDKFFTKVDDDMVFRISKNQPITIIPITEE